MRFLKSLAYSAISISLTFPLFSAAANTSEKPQTVKNVIVMIPDGMSVTGTTLARLYKGESLALDPLASGLMTTWNGDGTIADSAPAGSAISSGWKSQSGNIASTGKKYDWPGVKTPSQGEELRPVATLLEASRLSGRSVGIISTSEFMHATPADFSAHDPSRKSYDNLTEQIVYNNLDVILGGGAKYLKPENRADKEDMAKILSSRGYSIVNTPKQLDTFSGKKLVGVFGKTDKHTALSYDLDRDPALEPSLAQMTQKAIDVLSQNPDGFFLMIEGSKVDWAAHANDPVGIISDVLAFDDAVAKAVDFAKKDGNTLIVAMTDHGNSGISIGDRSTSENYDKTHWTRFINPLKKAKVTGEGFEAILESQSAKQDAVKIRALATQWLGVDDLTDEEVNSIMGAKSGALNYVIGPILAQRAKIGFTTNGHTGEDVVLYSYDPRGRLLGGLMDNTEVAHFMASALDVNLQQATEQLFLDANAEFSAKGATVSEDLADAENPVLVVTKGAQTLRVPRNKSVAWLNDNEVISDGVNVYNGSRWFVSKSLIDQIK
ncbi:alkaline phosphatase [Providencia sp. PROV273]|uniref:alkaline phosphatase n=1 Tax=Providencia sp. PROV273 TaxID=2949960 RepID=UPI002348FCC6|nr:alkaline phosphatase [Providencia sp. PROV273]